MAYTPHVLTSISGTWTDTPEEVWECTIRLEANGTGGDLLDEDLWLTDVHAPLAAWFSAATSYMSTKALLKTLKCNHVGANGKYIAMTTHRYDYPTAVAGTGTANVPGDNSLVYTWHTANSRGPAHIGRIYPPNIGVYMDKTFTVSNATAAATATAGKDLLTVLRNAGGVSAGSRGIPIIASKLGGQIERITGVSVDNAFDVQTRRKNRVTRTRSAIVAFP